tara:strand:+ start:1979 stop:2761 length:783 start_codon:yes stop_codon:yes gene_type:complete
MFYKPEKLPNLMVAPNGARPMKKDHSRVPVTIDEIVQTAKACFDVGAGGIHFHLRDSNGRHILNSEMCLKALEKLQANVPNMHLQITTEAVGRYSPEEMRKLAYEVIPPGLSIGIREMIPSRSPSEQDIKLYKSLTESGTKIQHICYEPEDIDLLSDLLNRSNITKDGTWCLFVIGHYSGKTSDPKKIPLFIEKLKLNNLNADWAVCAFGKEEFACLELSIKLGGKVRVGFENSMYLPNGDIAKDNETKVDVINRLLNLS